MTATKTSTPNQKLEHLLTAVLKRTAAFHDALPACLPADPCPFCRIQSDAMLALADVWETVNER